MTPWPPLFRVGIRGRPVAAMPIGSEFAPARKALVDSYVAITWRRALVRRHLGLMARLTRGSPINDEAIGVNLTDLQATLAEALGVDVASVGLMWPASASRNRLYLLACDHAGTVLSFGKVAWDTADRKALCHEQDALHLLDGRWGSMARVPRAQGRITVGEAEVLLAEPLPVGCLPTTQAERLQVAESMTPIADVPIARVRAASWWIDFEGVPCPDRFRSDLSRAMSELDAVRMRPIHGDLSPANALRAGSEIWLTDFEAFATSGPAFTDRVGAVLSAAPRRARSDPAAAAVKVINEVTHAGGTELDARLALAHRLASGVGDAFAIAQQWPWLWHPGSASR